MQIVQIVWCALNQIGRRISNVFIYRYYIFDDIECNVYSFQFLSNGESNAFDSNTKKVSSSILLEHLSYYTHYIYNVNLDTIFYKQI